MIGGFNMSDDPVFNRGGRGRGMMATITHDGATRTLAEWASDFGLTSDGLKYRIDTWGIVAAMRGTQPDACGKSGRRTSSAIDLGDLKMAQSSLANAARDIVAEPGHPDWLAHAHLSYRFLRSVLKRNRFPLEDSE